jgi:archaellum component FlaC
MFGWSGLSSYESNDSAVHDFVETYSLQSKAINVFAQREELVMEILGLEEEAERIAGDVRELVGDVPF